jgi:hypothetical protein
MTPAEIIDAINAYADAQTAEATDRAWLALTHRSNRTAAADQARALRNAGHEALDIIQEWPEVEKRDEGACVLQAPDGTRFLYFCERQDGRTFERLQQLS